MSKFINSKGVGFRIKKKLTTYLITGFGGELNEKMLDIDEDKFIEALKNVFYDEIRRRRNEVW